LVKGAQVYLEGQLRTEKYTDKNGVDKWSTKIICNQMQMLGGKRNDDQGEERPAREERQQRPSGGGYGQQSSGGTEPFPEDDIPFD
jgi:single-strand DNA-binding protein